jgi:hypothetical protein
MKGRRYLYFPYYKIVFTPSDSTPSEFLKEKSSFVVNLPRTREKMKGNKTRISPRGYS